MTDYQFLLNQEKKSRETYRLAELGTMLLIFTASIIWLFV